jgi:hypothetical protein
MAGLHKLMNKTRSCNGFNPVNVALAMDIGQPHTSRCLDLVRLRPRFRIWQRRTGHRYGPAMGFTSPRQPTEWRQDCWSLSLSGPSMSLGKQASPQPRGQDWKAFSRLPHCRRQKPAAKQPPPMPKPVTPLLWLSGQLPPTQKYNREGRYGGDYGGVRWGGGQGGRGGRGRGGGRGKN